MKVRRELILWVVALGTICLFSAIAYSAIAERMCRMRNTTVPKVPVFPGSILTSEDATDADSYGARWYEYTANASLANVIDFYIDFHTPCILREDKSAFCDGSLNPFGSYSMSIFRVSESSTGYNIQLMWDKCPSGWGWHKSVE